MTGTVSDAELAHLADLNYAEELRGMAVTAARGVHRKIHGVPVSLTGATHPAFNVALVTQRLKDVDAFVTEAMELARRHDVPLGIATRDDYTQELRPFLDELGYELETVEPSFVLHPLVVGDASPAELTIATVATPADYDGWVQTQADAFGMDVDLARTVFPYGLASLEGHELYVARWEGELAGSAGLVVTGEMAGVYGVATLERLRRRGIGRALTAHCLLRGLELGCTAACLQAYEAGRSLYLSMDFRQVAAYDCFAPAHS